LQQAAARRAALSPSLLAAAQANDRAVGGGIKLPAGRAAGVGVGGSIDVTSSASEAGASGNVTLSSAGAAGPSGSLMLKTGTSNAATSGADTLASGSASSASGDIALQVGAGAMPGTLSLSGGRALAGGGGRALAGGRAAIGGAVIIETGGAVGPQGSQTGRIRIRSADAIGAVRALWRRRARLWLCRLRQRARDGWLGYY
jgi:hypothetical protein